MLSIEKRTLIYILIAFTFSMAIRLIWVLQFSGTESFIWENQLMINTNDGYFWAEGARDLLNNFTLKDFFNSGKPTVQLTVVAAYILPFSYESIILYMPAFLGSLLVIPIILIAKLIDKENVGLIAAIFASIVWSYYNRTMVGYYDTDMLNIVFPTFILWTLMSALIHKKENYLIYSALAILFYKWWYVASFALIISFIGLLFLYTLIFERRSYYLYKLLSLAFLASMDFSDCIRLILVFVIFIIFKNKKFDKYIYYTFIGIVVVFVVTGGVSPIISNVKSYIFGSSLLKEEENALQVHFFAVIQTIREAGKVPFEIFANRISGHTVTFIFSIVGYIWMCLRYPLILLGLPMLGLGFIAYLAGLRFTIYAVPIMALGMAFLIVQISEKISLQFINIQPGKIAKYTLMVLSTLAILYPNIVHVINYKVPTVMNKQEVAVLDKLKNIASREDYVVAWWDYGYPIRYYADVKTLIDGGKHSGAVNFPVSFMLTNPQDISAKLARFDVEYTEKAFKIREENKEKPEDTPIKLQSNIAEMTLASGFEDTNDFISSLHVKDGLPQKTRDIYFYLPYRMLGILPTITKFSDLDLMSGKTIRKPFIYQTNRFQDTKELLNLDNGISLNKSKGLLTVGDKEVPLKTFYFTAYDNGGKLVRQKQELHKNGQLSIIFMRSYNTFLVLDNDMLNSTYIQLFVFENYDQRYFEPVILEPSAKVFKLKI